MSRERLELGRSGEERAAARYVAHGYEIVERNWRSRNGEIDLIVAGEGSLVICEVKTRSSNRFGTGAEAVDWRKQRKLRQLAAEYLTTLESFVPDVRFDVAWVSPTGVRVYENAF
ncbi:MAG: YraN family protein [Actinomycetia bacterium]|nr:YraN family protein [Actinomycetes bacterium]MCP4962501.1 YraN family protein [Actinomycetes bacterium]